MAYFSKDELDAFKSQRFTPQVEAKPKTSGRGGSASAWLSELGGTGGAMAGAAAGTAIMPGLGTILGGLAGGFLGGTGGKLAENKIRDDEFRLSESLGEGALEGLFAAGPLRLTKMLGKGGKALITGAGKEGAKEAIQEAALKPGVVKSLLSRVSGRVAKGAENVTNDAALKNFKINDSNWITKFAERVGEDPGAFAKRLGFAVEQPKNIAAKYYNPLQDVYETALDNIPTISKGTIEQGFKEVYEPLLKSYSRKEVGEKIRERATTLLKELPENVDAHDARAIKAEFQSLVDQTLTDKAGKLDNNINKQIADVFRKVINKSADDAGIKFSPDQLPVKGVKATNLTELGNELRGIKEFADKAAVKVNVGRGKNPLGLTPVLAAAGGGAAGGPAGIVTGAAIPMIANSNSGRKAEFKTASLISRLLNKGTAEAGEQAPKAIKPSKAGLVGRVITGSELSDVIQPDDYSSPLDPSAIDSTQSTTNANATPNAANISSLDSETDSMSSQNLDMEKLQSGLQQAALKALAAGDSKGLENIMKVANLFETMNKSKGSKLTASQETKAAAARNALKDMGQIEDAIASGKLGGLKALPGANTAIGSRLLGTEDLDAALFNIADNILRARSGAATPPDEVKRFVSNFLPRPTDSEEAKLAKLGRAKRELQGYLNPSGAAGAEDLITELQGEL